MRRIISTAHPQTFDRRLWEVIAKNIAVIRAYHERDAELQADGRSGGMRYILEPNPAAEAHLWLLEELTELFRTRTVRCWHYTRLTDDEIVAIRKDGVVPGSLESMQARIANQVEAGRLSEAEQAAILAASPLQDPEQAHGRLGTFWVTDRALHPTHDSVEPLLTHWGGEVVYFHLQDRALIARIRGFGQPVVLELAVPVASTKHAINFAESALSAVTEGLGYSPRVRGIDAYLTQPLGPEGLIAIHSAGNFDRVIADIESANISAKKVFARILTQQELC